MLSSGGKSQWYRSDYTLLVTCCTRTDMSRVINATRDLAKLTSYYSVGIVNTRMRRFRGLNAIAPISPTTRLLYYVIGRDVGYWLYLSSKPSFVRAFAIETRWRQRSLLYLIATSSAPITHLLTQPQTLL
jgi:hypothetical protein